DARLEAAEQLALPPQDDRHDLKHQHEDQERLDDLHEPQLVRVGLRGRCEQRHGLRTSTVSGPPPSVSAFALSWLVPSTRKTLPAGSASRSAARARTLVPFTATSIWSPGAMPSRRASCADSSARWCGARKPSTGAWSVSQPAQSDGAVPRRRPSGSSGGVSSSV